MPRCRRDPGRSHSPTARRCHCSSARTPERARRPARSLGSQVRIEVSLRPPPSFRLFGHAGSRLVKPGMPGVAARFVTVVSVAKVLTVNLAHPRENPDKGAPATGIDKRPTDEAINVRAPGPMHGGLGSGLIGDWIGNTQFHGGDDQAVYAYARADLDNWERQLDREIGNGVFGENLTTAGVDVTGALIGERWQIGSN